MKTYFLTIIMLGVLTAAQAQIVDSASYGNEEYRAVMGGGQKVHYDTITPLNGLIQRLQKPWHFVPTYKAYWIGYTDDMYSIARYKDQAIPLLINFIDTSKNLKAREGGLYTLHLIGIDRKVAGRFTENFSRKDARIALLRYLNDKQLNKPALYLLMRDPWLSDIPELMDYLSQSGRDYSKALGALQRYEVKNKPIGQAIDTDILSKKVTISYQDSNRTNPYQSIFELISYQKELGSSIMIDREISQSPEWVKGKSELSKIKIRQMTEPFKFSFSFFIGEVFDFSDFQDKFFYIFSDHKLVIYGPVKTRQIWLDWWGRLTDKEKQRFYSYVHPSFDKR
ncbi:MAG TPA: hypothetical protein VL442_08995 [Mucilaginibacter sp.]|jgi:hypothetical protein|nr:hypothetical protein [Mucilaginibacter sp.]